MRCMSSGVLRLPKKAFSDVSDRRLAFTLLTSLPADDATKSKRDLAVSGDKVNVTFYGSDCWLIVAPDIVRFGRAATAKLRGA